MKSRLGTAHFRKNKNAIRNNRESEKQPDTHGQLMSSATYFYLTHSKAYELELFSSKTPNV